MGLEAMDQCNSMDKLQHKSESQLPTLQFVMSMTEYAWSIWIKDQDPSVIEHLKRLVQNAPPNALRAQQIKSL
jgi:hypothetical protein